MPSMSAPPQTSRSEPRLLDRVRDKIRLKHYSIRTEQAYTDWVKPFIVFHGKRHPEKMGAPEIENFLTHLAVAGKVSAATQNQAKSALLFLYKEVLSVELAWLDKVESAKQSTHIPVVLTATETHRLLEQLDRTSALIARLLYGTGMRIMEGVRLRVKDAHKSWSVPYFPPIFRSRNRSKLFLPRANPSLHLVVGQNPSLY